MPKTLSIEHSDKFVKRFQEYIAQSGLTHYAVIFHGGEPLLAGAQFLVNFAHKLRKDCNVKVDVSVQTNGLLLTDDTLELFDKGNIGVSLSLDGPKSANDRHRLTRSGGSSFKKTEQALIRLQDYPSIFSGVISVIDVSTSANDLFAYFDQFNIPCLDFLLPDAHWLRQPPGRNQNSNIYEEWLINAFDIWFDHYPHIQLRTFESLLDACAGLPSSTDAFGFGDVSLLSIETDGSYHDLDVLKVTQDGATKLKGNLSDTSIAEVALSPALKLHRSYLRKEGLTGVCQACEVVDICGGGALPHRYGENGFANPTVYCNEMKRLVVHIKNRLEEHLSKERIEEPAGFLPENFSIEAFECAEKSETYLNWLLKKAKTESLRRLIDALHFYNDKASSKQLKSINKMTLESIAFRPGSIAWSNAVLAHMHGNSLVAADGEEVTISSNYLSFLRAIAAEDNKKKVWEVGCDDFWLRAPFGKAIKFENDDIANAGQALVKLAMEIIKEWRPALATEILEICSAVQFIRDPAADPDKIVSFSDNSVPGALYVSIYQSDGLIDPYDLADSLIHEHRHQKLYLLERCAPTVKPTSMQVISPWRKDLRPPSGLFHAVFVFVELRRFWIHVGKNGPSELHTRAENQVSDTDLRISQAFITLDKCPLTPVGRTLVGILKVAAKEKDPYENINQHSNVSVVA